MNHILLLLLLGLLAGALSGLIGIGGGIIIVPALVLLFGFSQTTAQDTALATLIPPVGLLAAFAYYQEGAIDIWAAVWIAVGFLIGGFRFGDPIRGQTRHPDSRQTPDQRLRGVAGRHCHKTVVHEVTIYVVADYMGGVVKTAPHPQAATDFITFLNSPASQAIHKKYGFLPPVL